MCFVMQLLLPASTIAIIVAKEVHCSYVRRSGLKSMSTLGQKYIVIYRRWLEILKCARRMKCRGVQPLAAIRQTISERNIFRVTRTIGTFARIAASRIHE